MRYGQNMFPIHELLTTSGQKIYVDRSMYPTFKYLLHFGELKNNHLEKDNQIIYERQLPHTLDSYGTRLTDYYEKMTETDYLPYDILIISDSITLNSTSLWKKESNNYYISK